MDALIDKQTYKYLNIYFPRKACLYAILKIHKNIETPPGNPIVSGIGSITENASRFVDFFLMFNVTGLPSYVRHIRSSKVTGWIDNPSRRIIGHNQCRGIIL